jgi:hypothetical protein
MTFALETPRTFKERTFTETLFMSRRVEPRILSHRMLSPYVMRFFLGAMMVLFISILPIPNTQAQDNLLQNPGFENTDQGYAQAYGRFDFTIARGWNGWYTQSPKIYDWMNIEPNAFPHSGQYKIEGFSQEIARGGGTFTAAVYQQVPNIPEGTTLRASAYVYILNTTESGAQVRIGIGYNTNDPNGDVIWGPWMRTVGGWQQISVERTIAEGAATVFIYATQNTPNGPTGANAVYFEDASLVAAGTGEVTDNPDGTGEVVRPAPTTPPLAPFVQAGGIENEQGQLVHLVQSGDTLAAIAVAYGVPVSELRELNNLEGRFLSIGQQIIIREAIPTETPAPTSTPRTVAQSGAAPTATDRPVIVVSIPTSTANADDVAPTDPDNSEANDDEDSDEEATEEATEEPTDAPTEEPTEEVTDEVVEDSTQDTTEDTTEEPTDIPTETPIPATSTPAPTAPVVADAADGNPVDGGTAVCVLMYDDADQNRLQLPGEGLLAGGTIALQNSEGMETGRHETDGEGEPFCFEGLSAGVYTATATAPEGYGLTTPSNLVVNVQVGVRLNISFGAAEGVEVAIAPTPSAQDATSNDIEEVGPAEPADEGINAILGIIVLGAAGVVLLGGSVVALIIRRS